MTPRLHKLLFPLLLFSSLAATTAPELPTTDDITAKIDQKQYPDALAMLARVLELKGAAAAPYNRHQLLMLKTECLLQQKDFTNALTTLSATQKEAKTANESYEALGLATLLKKSNKGIFTHPGDTDKLDILDKTQRDAAYKKFWADQLAAMKTGVKSDKNQKSINPILDDLHTIAPQRAIQYMATGKTVTTEKLAQELKTKAVKLLEDNLTQMNSKVDEINKQANVIIRTIDDYGNVIHSRKTGLSFAAIQSLRDIESTSSQYPATLNDLAKLFPDDEKTFATLNTHASTLNARATKLQNTQF